MDRPVAFLYSFLCAVALLGSGGTLAPETPAEERGPPQGAVVQNKAPSVIGCPVQRYPVRFGRDVDANLIDLSSFTRTTIEEMRSWPTPGVIPAENRISPYETTVLALEATLVEYRRERDFDDSDYRLVLIDESGRMIIAKISSSECAEADSDEPGSELPESRFLERLVFPRAEFTAWLSPTLTVERTSIHVQIMGIGMFEPLSGQPGEAPNGIQISPVLQISLVNERMPVISVPSPHHPRGRSFGR
jgi:hypothetical protein